MAELATLAHPYAKAVFELARSSGSYAAWAQDVSVVAQVVSHPQFSRLIGNPHVSSAQLQDVIFATQKLSTEGKAYTQLLVEERRLVLAPAIAAEFEALRQAAEAKIDVTVTTAVAMDDAQKALFTQALSKKLGQTVSLNVATDESLIGGALIQMGDSVIDASVRSQLAAMEHTLTA